MRERLLKQTGHEYHPNQRLALLAAAGVLFLVILPWALVRLGGRLDAGRFRWSVVPLPARLLAWLVLAAAGVLIFGALAANIYLSRMARTPSARMIEDRSSSRLGRTAPCATRCTWA